jgi:hypothetical protein
VPAGVAPAGRHNNDVAQSATGTRIRATQWLTFVTFEKKILRVAYRCGRILFSTVVKAKTAATPSLQGIKAVSGAGRMLYEKTILKEF